MTDKHEKSALLLGLTAALFFAVTFILNRLMAVSGGSWIWSSSFRFFFMIPFLLIIVVLRDGLKILIKAIRQEAWKWILWSTIGFGFFYAPLTFSAKYAPSWLVASTPFWIILSIIGVCTVSFPDSSQLGQTLIVAISSGVIATSLFFMATDKARKNQQLLASVEATQSGEVLFVLIGEIIILGGDIPDIYSIIGIIFVIAGMILHSLKH